MAVARRSRLIRAAPQDIWELIADPEHMPRWWPGVARMEGVADDRFTQVLLTSRGRPVRADFRVSDSEPPHTRSWEQEVEGTPFERVLNESIVTVELDARSEGTEVTIIQRQKLRGYSRTGGFLLRRATARKLDEALDGLDRILG
ncbi:MAG TPA: SRPBCC domain-containing protein [Solirubrobacteraceae bacterium]|nr:SRPBCC domain-containing protein [Solirubrobacteraceae bacterium]